MGTEANTGNRALEVGLTALAIAVGAVLTLVLATGAGGGSSTAEAPSGKAVSGDTINIFDFKYDPPNLQVEAGTEIKVTNEDDAAHTITSDDRSVDSGTISGNADGTVTFEEPGTYAYFCQFHPFMKGSVEVK